MRKPSSQTAAGLLRLSAGEQHILARPIQTEAGPRWECLDARTGQVIVPRTPDGRVVVLDSVSTVRAFWEAYDAGWQGYRFRTTARAQAWLDRARQAGWQSGQADRPQAGEPAPVGRFRQRHAG